MVQTAILNFGFWVGKAEVEKGIDLFTHKYLLKK